MGPLGVVGLEPGLSDRADLFERFEEMGIEHLLAERSVEALDKGILIGLAGLDVAESDALGRAPPDKRLGGELGAVVDPYPRGPTVQPDELVEDADDTGTRDRHADLDGERLAVTLVDDGECAEGPAVVEPITQEIERPRLVEGSRGEERLPEAHRPAALRPPRQVQAERAIHSMHAFMVPAMPRAPEAIEALPEPPATVTGHDVVQRGDHIGVPSQPGARRPVIRRPRQPHHLAGAPNRHAVLLHQHRQDFAFRGRRHGFRLKTSLIAAFSSASSAYIRFSLAFSASSSFNLLSSATDAPAYFARH